MDFSTLFVKLGTILGFILFVIGLAGNFVVAITCAKKIQRTVNSFIFIIFICFANCIAQFSWFFGYFIRFLIDIDGDKDFCKSIVFFGYFSQQWFAWLLIILGFDSVLSNWIRKWTHNFKTNRKPLILFSILTIILIVLNSYLIVEKFDYKFNLKEFSYNRYEDSCMVVSDSWIYVHQIVYFYVPCPSMVIINVILSYYKHVHRKTIVNPTATQEIYLNFKNDMSQSVIALNNLYLLLIIPESLLNINYKNCLKNSTQERIFIRFTLNFIIYSFHCLNFLIISIVNRQLRTQIFDVTIYKKFKRSKNVDIPIPSIKKVDILPNNQTITEHTPVTIDDEPNSKIQTKRYQTFKEFKCSREEIFKIFTDIKMIRRYSSIAVCEASIEGKFYLFNGEVLGRFVDLKPNEKIVMKWRLSSWPQRHFSIVIIELKENQEYTSLMLHQYGIPSDFIQKIEEDWNNFYWKTIKEKFGHELIINA